MIVETYLSLWMELILLLVEVVATAAAAEAEFIPFPSVIQQECN